MSRSDRFNGSWRGARALASQRNLKIPARRNTHDHLEDEELPRHSDASLNESELERLDRRSNWDGQFGLQDDEWYDHYDFEYDRDERE